MDLMSDRQIGYGGEGPIPWSAVGRWCDEHGITGDQRADVRYHVAKLDAVYLDHQAKKAKATSKAETPRRVKTPARRGK